jgi:hypothetical protein
MMVDTIQKLIDKTDYWDMRVLDVKASCFGDEVEILIENDEVTCWKISFLSCYKVSYNTDADRRKISKVKSMRKSQLGYYGQNITVCKSDKDDFYKINLDLSIMEMQIECQDILVEQFARDSFELFWDKN